MKTINEFTKNQLIANIVRSELKHEMSVFLCINNRTGNTLLTSQPAIWGGKRERESIGIICGDENGMGGDTYSTPIDEINSIEDLELEFDKIEENI